MDFILVRLIKVGHRRHVAMLLAVVLAGVFGGAAAFAATQHLPFTTGLYWAITTATTVGYGDVTPKNPSGRIVAAVVMLTTIPMLAAAFALFTGQAVANRVRRMLQMSTSRFPDGTYRLVIGSHPTLSRILHELREAGDPVVLVADMDLTKAPDGVHLISGDPTSPEMIAAAKPAGAMHALVCAPTDGEVLVISVLLREHAPKLPITALASSQTVAEALREFGIEHVVSSDDIVAHTLAKSLEAPHAGDLLLRLIDSDGHRLVERTIPPDGPTKALSVCRGEEEALVLGMVHDGKVSLGVGEDPQVAPGDILLLLEEDKDRKSKDSDSGSGRKG